METLSVVGKSVPRIDGPEKVRGEARYCSDFGMPGMLHAKLLRSCYAHARIKRIDVSRAERLPGVRAIVTPDDVPDMRLGMHLRDHQVLPRDKIVRCIGQAVVAVAADTLIIAEDALEKIRVDYEELPAVFDPEEAMKKDPVTIIHPELPTFICGDPHFKKRLEPEMPNVCYHVKMRSGDTEKAFAQADLVIENRYSTPRIHHCQMETHRTFAWIADDGTICIRTSSQSKGPAVRQLADLFGVSPGKVRIICPYVGGGFGGKVGSFTFLEPLAVLLAKKSGKPVSLVLTREEQFIDTPHRVGVITYVKDAVAKDGTLLGRQLKIILDCGITASMATLIVRACTYGTTSIYRIPNLKIDSYGVYTNLPRTDAYRGFGVPEVTWAIEQQMDMLADKLNIDPVEFRRKNLLEEGEMDASGQRVHSIGVSECLDKVTRWIGWGSRPVRDGSWVKAKGVAIGNKFTVAGWSSGAIVKVYSDGFIEVRHGTEEMGQGVNTVMAQIAAEEFGTSVDNVRVIHGDSAYCPYDFGAVSSRCTYHVGNAVRQACHEIKRQIFQMASKRLGVEPDHVRLKDKQILVTGWPDRTIPLSDLFNREGLPITGGELVATTSFTGTYVPEDPETGQSPRSKAYYAYGAHAVEIAVNVETGEIKVLRIAGAFDLGYPINPKMAEAQIEGGFGQGIGNSVFEEIVIEDGVVLNPNFGDYKIPKMTSVPSNTDSQPFLVSAPHQEGPFGAKGLGEAVLVPVAPAIGNALYRGLGIRVMDLPMTRMKVFQALREKGMV
ncbi:MAG: xanthine dehydrogenase family protein molybdopterin-binding subunit [Chloroflexi bacterium]|nr:xanthine dehydrogenase family protein molybdopterin-binding subunit [Chloroflexota bacterium]